MKRSTPPTGDFPPAVRQKQETPTILDRKIFDEFRSKYSDPQPDIKQLQYLLTLVIKHSEGTLEWRPPPVADPSVIAQIAVALEDAWQSQSLESVRGTGFLVRCAPRLLPQPPERSYSSDIIRGFRQDYRGAPAVDGFLEYLRDNEKKYAEGAHYGKFCSIVQSSGTGKSRLLCELARKDVIVLYMNLRGDAEDKWAFPPQDEVPARILKGNLTDEDTYTHKCHAFFAAVFSCLQERLSMLAASQENVIKAWNDGMTQLGRHACDQIRAKFFNAVDEKYHSILAQIIGGRLIGVKAMESALGPLHNMLQEMKGSRGPFLVIAVDEAHELTPMIKPGKWRPSIVICSVIADYSAIFKSGRCWVTFASTTSKVDFATPKAIYASARIAPTGNSLFPPYTELGWDQMATPCNAIPAAENAKLKYISGFGRPLWKSVGCDIENLELLARSKLAPGSGEEKNDLLSEENQLAVLAQRFCLDIYFDHEEAVSLIENGITSHGRIRLGTTQDRTWSFTTYPSEPFLSCVAAKILHKSPKARERILMTLKEMVKTGLVKVGKTGELANRLIFLLGKDLYARQLMPGFPLTSPDLNGPEDPEAELSDCKMVPIIGYLEYIFGKSFWGNTAEEAKNLFANAYINFTHWVPMKHDIGKREGITGHQWILRLWQRTSAVQCCHGQPMINAMIPMYHHRPELPLEERFSLCCISVKLTKRSNGNALKAIQQEDPSIDYSSDRPWIAILVDYGLDTVDVSASITPSWISPHLRDIPSQCLRIYAAGITSDTFKFLENQNFSQILQELVRFEGPPELHRKTGALIRKHTEFGSVAHADSMVWEDQGAN